MKKCVCALIAVVFALPVLMALVASVMSGEELAVVFSENHAFRWIPYKVTGEGYWKLLFESETYLATFWNSLLIAGASAAGHVLVSLVAAYGFERARFQGKELLFFLYVILMLMPFQVTLLPNYLLARKMEIYNTWWALILPQVFSPLGVFLMRQFIKKMSHEVMEAAYLDTSSHLKVLWRVVAPGVKGGLLAVAVLAFAESWNMVEQPLILLEDNWLYPLSVRLQQAGLHLRYPGSVLFMVPAVLLYFIFENELVEGVGQMHL